MPTVKEAFHLARSEPAGPVVVDICKDAQQSRMAWTWDPSPIKDRRPRAAPRPTRHQPEHVPPLMREVVGLIGGNAIVMTDASPGFARPLVSVPAAHRANLSPAGQLLSAGCARRELQRVAGER